MSQQQYRTRTHAGGALGNEPKDKPKKKSNRKRQAGYGGKDHSEDKEKSFGGAGLERKEERGGPPGQLSGSYVVCNLCEKTPGRAPGTPHWTDSCPLLSASQIPKLKTNNVSLGCLRYKGDRPGHRCPPQLSGALFCNVCKTSKKICATPASHTSVPIPPTFNGAALGSHSRPAAHSGQTASPRTGPTHGARVPPGRQGTLQEGGGPQEPNDDELNVAILAMHAGTRGQPVENKGRLGDPASLTGWVTLKKGADVTMVPCLYDSGSESTYFHPELEPMGLSRRKKTFYLETLSMQGGVEQVDGLIVTFEAVMADGQTRKIEALKHHGLGRSGHQLRAKVLSVPTPFAHYWGLEQKGLTQLDPTNPHNSLYTRQPNSLTVIMMNMEWYSFIIASSAAGLWPAETGPTLWLLKQ